MKGSPFHALETVDISFLCFLSSVYTETSPLHLPNLDDLSIIETEDEYPQNPPDHPDNPDDPVHNPEKATLERCG